MINITMKFRIYCIIYFLLFTLHHSPYVFAGTGPHKESVEQLHEVTLGELKKVFLKTIKTYSPWSGDEIEIRNLRIYPSRIKVPNGKISFDARPPANGRYLGRVTIPVTILVNKNPVHRVQVSGEVEVYTDVLCAKRGLKKGDLIKAEDLVVTRRPLSRLHGEPITEIADAVGMELKRGLRSGQIIRKRDLKRPFLVRRGQLVTVIARSPHVLITLPGRAQDSGAKGEVIRVKNLSTKKVLLAEVKGPKTVEVVF